MQYKAVDRSYNYLCHFNPNHDPKSGQFTTAKSGSTRILSQKEMEQENRKLLRSMRSGKTAKDFKGNVAIRQLISNDRLLKARAKYKEVYDKYKKTGWPKGLNSAADEYSTAKDIIMRSFVGNNARTRMSKGNLDKFTGDWRDSIFIDDYMGRISHLIDYELGMDEVNRYWMPDKSKGGWDDEP